MTRVTERVPGDVVGAQLNGTIYFLRVIDRKGRLLRVRVDALSGDIVNVEGR